MMNEDLAVALVSGERSRSAGCAQTTDEVPATAVRRNAGQLLHLFRSDRNRSPGVEHGNGHLAFLRQNGVYVLARKRLPRLSQLGG
jgi:hypothetical protein